MTRKIILKGKWYSKRPKEIKSVPFAFPDREAWVTEHVFHPVRKWRFDYAHVERKIAVECEGGIWRRGGGAHSHPSNIMRDLEKYNAAAALDWLVFRFTTDQFKDGTAGAFMRRYFEQLKKQ